ncbi:hypothetical protein BKK79_19985 [Cupriavidus sp. USMAA2-4]|uniref:hypothetical protein n=1 Tax=Cupriavidus sp. USMAA2-4 TaxID=876364 RepID=UPI0008A6D1E1|nr:hypothetical protein [Cupriavidus sp. USMAA2-4]AOY93828.1 hypothetical protein BKK79_19985 [Cupriavidus sp. USMAA2-4]
MADLADVSRALVALIAQTAYPAGTAQPSISGQPVKVYAGWPNPAQLADDLKAGKQHISVFPRAVKPTDAARSKWRTVAPAAHSLTLTVAGQAVTVGGTVATPQNASLVIDGAAYPYAVQAGDTLTSIATALAALISADQPATSSGAVVTIPGARDISPRVGGAATRLREVRRQDQEFLITVWANCYDSRDPLAAAIDATLADTNRITLPDGSFGTLRSRPLANSWDDSSQKERIYRRDLCCWIEYSTTVAQQQYEVTQGQIVVEDDGGRQLGTVIL